MKLPFRKNKEFLTALYDILGFYPHNIEIYRIAFAHKSINHQQPAPAPAKPRRGKPQRPQRTDYPTKPLNNERLEFLGDAVLETVVSDLLYRHFENQREGFLTATRSKIVQRDTLNKLSEQMGLTGLIQAAQGTTLAHTNIGGNAFEALMGAIYLDRGFKFCHWFISQRVMGRYIDVDNMAHKEVNFKSKLLEWSQKNRININYRDISRKSEGKGFSTVLTIEGITVSRGEGRSKKESQQEASKEALTRMRKDAKFYDSLFRAKEKRTAMEAEESFALPKIDEIEEGLASTGNAKRNKAMAEAPVLERKTSVSDSAYDKAYDADADYEVIDHNPDEQRLTAADYEAKGLPAPPDEDDAREVERRPKRTRQHRSQTVDRAVKGFERAGQKPAQPVQPAESQPAQATKQGTKEQQPRTDKNNRQAKTPQKSQAPQVSKPAEQATPSADNRKSRRSAKNEPVQPQGSTQDLPNLKAQPVQTPQTVQQPAAQSQASDERQLVTGKSPVDMVIVKDIPAEAVAPAPNDSQEGQSKRGDQVRQATKAELQPSGVDQPKQVAEQQPKRSKKQRSEVVAAQSDKSELTPLPYATDFSPFEPFEVDNLPDITGENEADEAIQQPALTEEGVANKPVKQADEVTEAIELLSVEKVADETASSVVPNDDSKQQESHRKANREKRSADKVEKQQKERNKAPQPADVSEVETTVTVELALEPDPASAVQTEGVKSAESVVASSATSEPESVATEDKESAEAPNAESVTIDTASNESADDQKRAKDHEDKSEKKDGLKSEKNKKPNASRRSISLDAFVLGLDIEEEAAEASSTSDNQLQDVATHTDSAPADPIQSDGIQTANDSLGKLEEPSADVKSVGADDISKD